MSLIRRSMQCMCRYSSTVIRSLSLNVLSSDALVPNDTGTINVDKISILSPESGKNIDLSTYAPDVVPTFNFAAYINRSPTLQKWVDLGVDLAKLERKKGIPQYVLGLDFERDMKNHIQFLHDNGVPADNLGYFLTKNPLIFKEEIESLLTRIEYLQSKHFLPEEIVRVISANPHWLMFSVDRIDNRLDFFKQHFMLNHIETRSLACKEPRLITYNVRHVEAATFSVREEMGFNNFEIKKIVLSKPKVWMISNHALVERFHVVHNEMHVPHKLISQQPQVLLSRASRLKHRHLFLASRGAAQYDPRLPKYVSMTALAEGSDGEFAVNVAHTSLHVYSDFLKTM